MPISAKKTIYSFYFLLNIKIIFIINNNRSHHEALQIKQLEEKDTIIAETLVSLGLNKNIALALTYLRIRMQLPQRISKEEQICVSLKSVLP